MNQCYLDANFLIYLKNENAQQHKEVQAKLIDLLKKKFKLCISPLVIDEFIHAMLFSDKSRNRLKHKIESLKNNLKEILNLPFIVIVSQPIDSGSQLKVLDLMSKYNLKPRDAYHLLTMISNSIDSFATFDTDFRKVFASKLLKKV